MKHNIQYQYIEIKEYCLSYSLKIYTIQLLKHIIKNN